MGSSAADVGADGGARDPPRRLLPATNDPIAGSAVTAGWPSVAERVLLDLLELGCGNPSLVLHPRRRGDLLCRLVLGLRRARRPLRRHRVPVRRFRLETLGPADH